MPSGAFYSFGDIIKQKDKSGNFTYWVCVRPCSVTHKLRKTHWATFQLLDENFKKFDDNTYLPTKLSSSQSEGERMVQNFFNVLRVMANPSLYDENTTIDQITQDEFPTTSAEAISNIWDITEAWNTLAPLTYVDGGFFERSFQRNYRIRCLLSRL